MCVTEVSKTSLGSLYKNILKLAETKRMAYRREEGNREKSDEYFTLKREKSE